MHSRRHSILAIACWVAAWGAAPASAQSSLVSVPTVDVSMEVRHDAANSIVHAQKLANPSLFCPDGADKASAGCGDPNEWQGTPDNPPNMIDNAALTQSRVAVVQTLANSTSSPTNQDALYLFLVVSDNTFDPADPTSSEDSVSLHLDTEHNGGTITGPDDVRISFRRGDMTVNVSTGATVMVGCGSATNDVCIIQNVPGGIWIIEAKLTSAQLGTNALAGTMGGLLLVHDDGAGSGDTPWPVGGNAATPNTWGDLDLGMPADVILVLDYSGSMNWPAGTSGSSRKAVLQHAVTNFLDLYGALAAPADRIALVEFRQDVDPLSPMLVTALNNLADVKTNVDTSVAVGWTAMGGGLHEAVQALVPDDPDRLSAVVLFTDGEQNVNPMVQNAGGGVCDGSATPLRIANSSNVTINSNVIVANPFILPNPPPIYTIAIAIETSEAFLDCLKGLSTDSNAITFTTDAAADLPQAFVDALVAALRDHSPQLLRYRKSTVAATTVESFTANQSSRQIVLDLSWPGDDRLTFSVRHDGVAVPDAAGTWIDGDFHRIFSILLPTVFEGMSIEPGGEWEMVISGPPGADYQAAALSDELSLEYEVAVGRPDLRVGDSLLVDVDLTVGGVPVTDATVSATIRSPTIGIGTLVSTNRQSVPDTFMLQPGATPAQNKLHLLLRRPEMYRSIQPISRELVLQSNGDGSYSAAVPSVGVPGAWTAVVHIEGEHPIIGSYRREDVASTYVRFGELDVASSQIMAFLGSPLPDNRREVRLVFRPVDGRGNYLGPGNRDRIQVSVGGSPVGTGTILSRLDGTYEVPFTIPAGSDPQIELSVSRGGVHPQQLSDILVTRRFWALLAGGAAFPTGSFNMAFDPGLNVLGGVGVWATPSLLLGGFFGYNGFKASASGGSDTYWLNISVNARAYRGHSTLRPFVGLGPGLYVPKSGSTEMGGNVGVGLQIGAGRISFEAGGDFHTVFGSSSDFVHAHAGLAIGF